MAEPDPLAGVLCHHHRSTLAGWRERWTHEDPDEHARRIEDHARQCRACQHLRGEDT